MATPEISAPPPMETSTSVGGSPRATASRASSSPTVPCAATITGSSNGCTSVRPARCSSPACANAAAMSEVSCTSAPAARAAATDRAGAVRGMTTTASTPAAPATSATASPWLPPDTATTPAARSVSVSDASLASTPRGLNDPARCRCSSLSSTGAPRAADSPGEGTVGVRTTPPALRSAAVSMSAMLTWSATAAT